MNFEQRCTIPVDRQRLWAFLMDVPAMGSCVPGVSQVQPVGDGRYQGAMAVRLGPVSLHFDIQVTVQAMDQERWHAAMQAEAQDRRVGGSVRAAFQMQLEEATEATYLVIRTEINLLGRLGQFGQPLVRRKADSILDEFAANVRQRISAAAPVSGEVV